MYFSIILFWSKPVQKHLIYDRIDGEKENVLLRFFSRKGKILWLLFNGWSRRFKIIKHCEVE